MSKMNSFKENFSILRIICIFVMFFGSAICYPITSSEGKLDKAEKQYPNGTVVGKYSYTDNEGNPIQVKYYADDSSYGVELKSIKLVADGNTAPGTGQTFKQPITLGLLESTDTPLETSADFYNPTNTKYKINDPFEILNKDKENERFKDFKTNPDYEIYFQNELKAPKKCGKDKVRVYFDKDKRKIREAPNGFDDTVSICNRFG